jgi:hypothetical protein
MSSASLSIGIASFSTKDFVKSKCWLLLWSLLQTTGHWGQVEGEEAGFTRKSEKSDQRLDSNVLYCSIDGLDGLGNCNVVTSSYVQWV